MPWLEQHKPVPKFRDHSLRFNSPFCLTNCIPGGQPYTIHSSRHRTPPEARVPASTAPSTQIAIISAYAAVQQATKHPDQVVWLHAHHFEKADGLNPYSPAAPVRDEIDHKDAHDPVPPARDKPDSKDMHNPVPPSRDKFKRLFEFCHAGRVTNDNFHRFFDKLHRPPKSLEEIKSLLPEKYWPHLQVFNPVEANVLPP
ncbi:hypothetical protein NX059_012387 [Plenodomus lindquistii]|nr:hypothetical protein NX059_012387 [Plenodomus lindquistii]